MSILKTHLSKRTQDMCCLGVGADASCSVALPESLSGGRGTTSGRSLALGANNVDLSLYSASHQQAQQKC